MEPAPRFELGVTDLQSVALPLGYAGLSAEVYSARALMSINNRLDLPIYCGLSRNRLPNLMKRKLFCTIPQKLIKQPLLFTLVNRFKVVPNIRGASVTETIAILSLELEGDEANVEEAVQYLKDEGVQVEVLEEGEERSV